MCVCVCVCVCVTNAEAVRVAVVVVVDSHGIDVTLLQQIQLSPPVVSNGSYTTRSLVRPTANITSPTQSHLGRAASQRPHWFIGCNCMDASTSPPKLSLPFDDNHPI